MIVRRGEIYFWVLIILSYAFQIGDKNTYLGLSLIVLCIVFFRALSGDFSRIFEKLYVGLVIWYLCLSFIDINVEWTHDIRWLHDWFGFTIKRAEFVSGRPSSTGLSGLFIFIIGVHRRKLPFISLGAIIIFWADSRSAIVALLIHWMLMEVRSFHKLIIFSVFLIPIVATFEYGYNDRIFLYSGLFSELFSRGFSIGEQYSHAHNLILEGFRHGYLVGLILVMINFHFFKMAFRGVDDNIAQYHLKIAVAYLTFNFFQSGWLVEGININSIFVLHSMTLIFFKKNHRISIKKQCEGKVLS